MKQTAQQVAQQIAQRAKDESAEFVKSTKEQVNVATEIANNNYDEETSTLDAEAIKQEEEQKLQKLRARLSAMMESGMLEARQERLDTYQNWQKNIDEQMQQNVQDGTRGDIIAQGKPRSSTQAGKQRAISDIEGKREKGRGNKG